MNTKGNQRYQDTKLKIEKVFQELLKEKDVSKISVSEICRGAGIHRTTFYGHFDDVGDLMRHMIQDMYRQVMDHFIVNDKLIFSGGFLSLFEFIKDHKYLFQGYLESCNAQNLPCNILPDRLLENIESVMRGMSYENEQELYYHQTFFSEGLKAVIKMWLSRDCAESPDEMCRILDREYKPNIAFFDEE